MQGLHEQWQEVWKKVSGKGKGMVPYADLVSRYSEPWRAYHTMDHLYEMLAEFDELRRKVGFRSSWLNRTDPLAIQMAIWYHDVVYSTQAKDNEERSADLFYAMSHAYRLGADLTDRVIFMIGETKHARLAVDPNAQVLCDIDLAILGKFEFDFDEYEKQIRREYEWVPDQDFYKGRAAILESFLKRPSIYATEYFRKKYEEQARKNLDRSIKQLKSAMRQPDPDDEGGGLFSKSPTSTGTGGLFSRD